MKRLLAIAVLLTACSCSHTPVASAEHDLDVIDAAYAKDVGKLYAYRRLPLCTVAPAPQCLSYDEQSKVLTASYNASDALTRALGERTDVAIAKARAEVAKFTEAANKLPVP